jgi:colicin import membrane protein
MNKPNPLEAEEAVETSISEYRPVEAGLALLREKYEGVVFDVSTANSLQEARNARLEIREPRYECEKIRKRLKAPALEYSRRIDTEAARITAELENLETPIDDVIKREEAAAEARREAKRKAEEERVARLRRIVEGIRAWPLDAVNANAQELRDLIDGRDAMVFLDLPEEIRQEATEAKEEALKKLREMLAAREAREAEEVRLAAERRAEQERQAAEDKRLREERQRIETERQRAAEEHAREQREAQEANQRLAEERAELDRQHAEHARIERELADERTRIAAERARAPEPVSVFATSSEDEDIPSSPEMTGSPSDSTVLRDLAHVLERGGEPYGWIPNRLRTIAARLEVLEPRPSPAPESGWP